MSLERDTFFRPPNTVNPEGRSDESTLATMALNSNAPFLVLPWRAQNQHPRWYAAVDTDRLEQVREELVAHVGVSYTDYRGQVVELDPDDPGDRAAALAAPSRELIRIELLHEPGHARVSAAMLRFVESWQRRPERSATMYRPVAELLTAFRLAMLAGARTEAETLLRELRDGGDLEVLNLLYLEIDLVSRFDGPAAVLRHPQIGALLRIRRPARVTDLLAQAVDQVLLRPNGESSLVLLKQRFSALEYPLQRLVISPGECRSSSGLLLVVLRALTSGISLDLADAHAIDVVVDSTTRAAIDELQFRGAEVSVPPTAVDSASLSELLDAGQYQRVLELALQRQPTFEIVDAALRAASWLDSLPAARQALDILESAAAEVQERFVGNRLVSPLIEALRSLIASHGPKPQIRGWNDLLGCLAVQPDWSAAVDAAEHGALEWDIGSALSSPAFCSQLASNITRASESAPNSFARIVPHLIEWLDLAADQDQPHLLDTYEALIAYFAFHDRTRVGLEILGAFATDVLAIGLSQDRYNFCLDNLEVRWDESASPVASVWASDILEALIDQPCPDNDRRLALASNIVRKVASFFDRLDDGTADSITSLAHLLGLGGLLPSLESRRPGVTEHDLGNLLVGIYSLMPGALQRATAIIEHRWPTVRVESRSDHVATDPLRQLARRADLMIVATRSASHEATKCIASSRPTDRPTVMPGGKGSASILRAMEQWVRGQK